MESQDNAERDRLLQWLFLKHFKRSEAWGDPDKMHKLLMGLIDAFRDTLPQGCWIKVHCGYKEGGHTKNSYHYKGEALDFHVVGMTVLEAEAHLMRFLKQPKTIDGVELQLIDFVGLGIYPDWANPGFHLDIRGKRASWARLDGKYIAYELGLEYLKTAS